MNHLDSLEVDLRHQQTELPQRLTTAIVTIILAALIFYGFPYLAHETTIKRSIYEFSMSLIPTKFVNTFQKAATGLAGRSGVFPQPASSEHQNSTISEGSGILSVVQRARTLSGFDKFTDKTQDQTYSGLGNWDNSCYQNSVLQGLASLSAFKAFVEKSWFMCKSIGIEAPTIEALQVFVNELLEDIAVRRTLWPPSVLKSMNTWQQQDAQEYFSKIMDAIDKESARYHQRVARRLAPGLDSLRLHKSRTQDGGTDTVQHENGKRYSSVEATLPRNPLDGTLSQVLRCQNCGFSEGLFLIPFNCLTLNLGLGGNCYLEDLLDAYTDPELIEGVECEECTRVAHRKESEPDQSTAAEPSMNAIPDATAKSKPTVVSTKAKQILLGRLPQDLVIHINRSIFDNWGNQRKNTSLISFPPVLDIVDDWVASMGQISVGRHGSYELKCTVTHSGRHDNGHYVAYGKRGKEWYSFNDEIVSKVSEEQVLDRGNVFLLFYELTPHEGLIEVNISQSQSEDSSQTFEVETTNTDTTQDNDSQPSQNPKDTDVTLSHQHSSKL